MPEVTIAFIISAFIAGVLMFLAPCTLPLVPVYVAFIGGVTQTDLSSPSTARSARRKVMINGVAFVLGFSVVFILFGVLAGAIGSQIGQYRAVLAQVGGVFIMLFGLLMLDLWRPRFLAHEHKVAVPKMISPGHPFSAFLIGVIFALGWTPCVGPVLASVILLATTSTTVVAGGFMLAVFSLGLAVPFLLTAALYARAERVIARYSWISRFVSLIGGIFLLLLGFLLLTNNFEIILIYGYQLFDHFNFSAFYDYL